MAALPRSNPAVIQIREAAGRGKLSHALLFTGPGDRLAAARFAAARNSARFTVTFIAIPPTYPFCSIAL